MERVEHGHRRRHRVGDHRALVVLRDLRAHLRREVAHAARRAVRACARASSAGGRGRVGDVVARTAPRRGQLAPDDLAGLDGVDAVDLVDVLGQSLERAFEAREPRLHQRRQRRRSVDAGRLGDRRSGRAGGRAVASPAATITGTTSTRLSIGFAPLLGRVRRGGAVRPWTVHRRYGPRRGARARRATAGGDRRPQGTATPPGVVRIGVACVRVVLIRLIPALARRAGHRRSPRCSSRHRPTRGAPVRVRLPDLDQETPDGLVVVRAGPAGRATVPARVPLRGAQRRRRTADHRRPPRGRRPRDAWSPTRSSSATAPRAPWCRDVGRLRYVVSPDHRHWHLLRFERYELRRPGSRSRSSRDRKTGFCLGDRYAVTGRALPAGRAGAALHEPLRPRADAAARHPRRDLRRLRRRLRGQPRGPVPPAHRGSRTAVRARAPRRTRTAGSGRSDYGNNAASVLLRAALARRASRTCASSRAARTARAATAEPVAGLIGYPAPAIASSCCRWGRVRGRSQ